MYLSKLIINLMDRDVLCHFTDSYYWHRNIMSAFPHLESETPRKDLGILFRKVVSHSCVTIYVQSKVEPDWTEKSWIYKHECKSIDSMLDSLANGSCVSFDLLCTPYYTDTKNKLRSYIEPEKKLAWFTIKGKYHGFEVIDIATKLCTEQFTNIGNKIDLDATNLIGRLRIVDVEKFRDFYLTGVGREKAYGAGMLLLTK